MNFFCKKMLIVVTLLNVTIHSFGYTYEISNATDKTLVVRLVERTVGIFESQGDQYATLKPREQKVMELPGLWCLKAIQAQSFNTLKEVPSDMTRIGLADVAIKMESSNEKNTPEAQSMQKELNQTKSLTDKNAVDTRLIEKAASALAEQSLCRNRKFVLMFTGKKAQKVIGDKTYNLPFDEIIAVTAKGLNE